MSTPYEGGKTVGSLAIVMLSSFLYLSGLCPTISWFDSPEFVTVPHTLGIGHPSGSPTYALIVKLATFLPLGSVALRVNACSTFAAVFALVCVFRLLYGLAETSSSSRIQHLTAWSGTLFLLVSESFWRLAEVAEVYLLQNCFFILLIFLLIKARASAPPLQQRYAWVFAFLYGLSAGVHAAMAFFLPAFLAFFALALPRLLRSRAVAFLAFFFLLGFATYLYLPIRSLTEPAFNWGEPQTWEQFWIHISDRKDAAVHTAFFWQQVPFHVSMYFTHLGREFALFGCVLGGLGFVRCWRRDKALWVLLTLAWFGYTMFFIRSWWDTAWGFIPSFVIVALWIGLGTQACLEALSRVYQRHTIRVPRVAVATLFLAALLFTVSQLGLRHTATTSQASNYAAEVYGKVLLEQLPPDAILFCQYAWFPLLYLQHIERQRPDLTFILQGEVFSPRYFSLISSKRFPNIQQVTSPQPVVVSTAHYFWLFAKLNAVRHPLFWDPDSQYQPNFPEHVLPQGLLFAFDPVHTPQLTPSILRQHETLVAQSMQRILQGELDDFTTYFLANKLTILAAYFRQMDMPREAHSMFHAALAIRPNERLTHNNYGAFLVTQGEYEKALEHYNIVYEQEPVGPLINKNVGTLMLHMGDAAQAVHFFEKALALGSTDGDTYARLGEAYARLSRSRPALEALRSALRQYQQRMRGDVTDTKIQAKITLVQQWIEHLETQELRGTQTQ